nr:hypothetical protein [Tanacetum cinerariifolium]
MTLEAVQAMIDQTLLRNNTTDDEAKTPVEGLKDPYNLHWNGHVRTLGHDAAYAMTWEILKKKLMDKYCPKGEIKKLEIELWNLKISGLPDNIHGNVMAARPKTLDDAIELANDLMDQKLCTYAERQAENKRKPDNNHQAQQQLLKKQNVAQAYVVGTREKKSYGGSKPLYPKCNYYHDGECVPKCTNCKKISHLTKDCWHPIRLQTLDARIS